MADTELTDPLSRRIVLHDRTGWGHVLKGRPGMRELRSETKQAIREPLTIWTRRAGPIVDCISGRVPEKVSWWWL